MKCPLFTYNPQVFFNMEHQMTEVQFFNGDLVAPKFSNR